MVSKEKLIRMLRLMCTIRFFEEKTKELFRQGLITGAIHSYVGEEAVAVGACSALEKKDYIVSTHRGHGHCVAKGGDLKKMMAELMGKESGYCHGHGGSMHLFDLDIGLLGGNGIVGGGIPIAVGAAYSAGYRKTKQVSVSFFSEGASNQGTFHESLNMAALWKLPVIFVCENNQFAATTPAWRTLSIPDIADRAYGYGIPGKIVDGNDVLKVYEAVSEAVVSAREGKGPSLIECKTYRYEGHCMVLSDVGVHRTKEDVEKWRKKDPITNLEKKLLKDGVMTEDELKEMKDGVKKELDEAVDFAKESPYPDVESLLNWVIR